MIRMMLLIIAAAFVYTGCSGGVEPFDIAITGGTVLDGSGSVPYRANVYISGQRIAEISTRTDSVLISREVIDARGMIVTPGFIDAHSHSDYTLLVDGMGQSKIRQGVTTEIIGEVESGGPVFGPAVGQKNRELEPLDIEVEWETLEEYFDLLEMRGIAPNIASLVGVGQVRMCVMGEVDRKPTEDEMERMKTLVAEAMEEGAIGLSAGLEYVPDMFTTTEELIELASVAAEYGGVFSAHVRSEGDELLESLDEMIAIGKEAHIPVHVMHMKASRKANWDKMDEAIHKIEAARAEGVDFTADIYPYAAAMTTLNLIFPGWVREGGTEKLVERLEDPEERAKIKEYVINEKYGFDSYQDFFGRIMIARIPGEENREFEGKMLWDILQDRDVDPIAFLFDLLIEERAQISAIYFMMSDENKYKLFKQPWVCVGSDGTAVKPEGILGEGHPHPRFYGSFPRVISKYVLKENLVPLEEAVRKMTSLPARIFNLRDRGLIEKGKYADIVVFRVGDLKDHATFENPHCFSTGVSYLFINGLPVIRGGEPTVSKPGRVLRHRKSVL